MDKWINNNWMLISAMLASASLLPAQAAEQSDSDDDADEVTITVLDESSSPDDIISIIELPEVAAEEAVEASRKGLDTANESRARHDEAELPDEASTARERAAIVRDQADAAADDASERVLDRVGSGDLEDLPDDVRDRLPDNLPDPDDRPEPPPPPGGNGG